MNKRSKMSLVWLSFYCIAALALSSCSDVARRQININLLLHDGSNVFEVNLKSGKYVLQFKEYQQPITAFTVQGEMVANGLNIKIDKKYVPSEKADGAMVVFNMDKDARFKLNVSLESTDKTRPIYMTLGPYQ